MNPGEVLAVLDHKDAKIQELQDAVKNGTTEIERLTGLAAKLLERVDLPPHVREALGDPEKAVESLEWLIEHGPKLKPAGAMANPNTLDAAQKAKQAVNIKRYV